MIKSDFLSRFVAHNEMKILQKIDLLKAELDALRPLDAEREGRIMQKFRLDWNYHYSRNGIIMDGLNKNPEGVKQL